MTGEEDALEAAAEAEAEGPCESSFELVGRVVDKLARRLLEGTEIPIAVQKGITLDLDRTTRALRRLELVERALAERAHESETDAPQTLLDILNIAAEEERRTGDGAGHADADSG